MGTPITWRNVDAPAVAGAASLFQGAQNSFNSGFDKLGDVLKERQAAELANWNQQKTNNTNEFMNTLAQYRTPEEYQAALNSGSLQQLLASRGAQIDQQAARTAMDSRLGALQERLTKAQAFEAAQTGLNNAPAEGAFLNQALNGDYAGALAGVAASGLPEPKKAEILVKLNGMKRQGEKDKREDAATDHAQKIAALTRPQELATAEDNAVLSALEKEAAKVGQTHKQDMDARYVQVGSVAKELGLPVDSAGRPRISDMNSDDLTKLDTGLKAKNLPGHKEYLTGDTKARDAYLTQLQQRGVAPHILGRLNVDSAFNSGGNGLVGQDADNRDHASAANNVMYKKVLENNWFSVGHPDAKKAFEEIEAEVPKLIDRSTGYDQDEDIAPLQGLVQKWATQGIALPGRKERFIPPASLVRHAIRTASGGWFTDSQRAGAAEKILEESIANYPDLEKRLKESAESEQYMNREAVKAEKAKRRQEAAGKILGKDK